MAIIGLLRYTSVQLGNGEWGMGNGEWGIGERPNFENRYTYNILIHSF